MVAYTHKQPFYLTGAYMYPAPRQPKANPKSGTAVITASRSKVGSSLEGVVSIQAKPAIYMFEILPIRQAYVGQTVDLDRRMEEYLWMMRRLLALYGRCPRLLIDKDEFRTVHYWLADAVVCARNIHLHWFFCPKPNLNSAEDSSIEEAERKYPGNATANGEPNFEEMIGINPPLTRRWQEVRDRIRTARRNGPPFIA